MRAYSVFDDLPQEAVATLEGAGAAVTLHPSGVPRPSGEALRALIEAYDIVLISTAETVTEEMLHGVRSKKIIGTVSSGIDHIHVPADKTELIRVANAPTANALSVAEHTFALALALKKRFFEARDIALRGDSKKSMQARPTEMLGKTLGVIGAGHTASAVMRLGKAFGMRLLCWTRDPLAHAELQELGARFEPLNAVFAEADVLSVNIPLVPETRGLISKDAVAAMKQDATVISTSRTGVVDIPALLDRAKREPMFTVGLDIDAGETFGLWNAEMRNVIVTPHIAGGTEESRRRLFYEVCAGIVAIVSKTPGAEG